VEPLILGLPVAFSVAGFLGLAHLYVTAPRCPECSSLRATRDAYDSEIRVCRDCHTIYRLHA
jgi:hypothetical protein